MYIKKTDFDHEGKSTFEKRLVSISEQAGIFFLGKLAFHFITFFTGIMLARILGATLLGQYILGLVTIQALTNFTKMGFDQGLVRFIPIFNLDSMGKTKRVIQNNILISLILSTTLALILYLFSNFIARALFHSPAMAQVLKIFSFYLPVFGLFSLGAAVLRGFKRADIQSHIQNIITPIILIILLSILVLLGGNLTGVIMARLFSHLVSIGFIVYFLLRNFSEVFKHAPVPYDFKRYLSFSSPLLLIGLLYFFIGHVDLLMLGYFLDSDQVGIYSVAVRIAMLNIFGLQAVNMIFAPNISELSEIGDMGSLAKLLKVLTKWVFYFSLFLFAFVIIFRIEILKLFGTSFVLGSTALVILAGGQLLNAFAGPTGTILIMAGKQKWEILNSIGMLILNVILNLILIPKFAIEGAAIATATSISVINLFKLVETYMEFGFHPYDFKYFKGILAIMAGTLVALIFHGISTLNFVFTLVFGGMVISVTTLAAYYFLKFDEEELVILRKIALKINFQH